MPFVFIHGVNVRDTGHYQKDLVVRNEMIRTLIFKPLAKKRPAFEKMEIGSPYWGGYGVTFRWKHASLPEVTFLESMGAEMSATPQSDIDIASTVQQLAGTPAPSKLEPLGASDNSFRAAALKDQVRFAEAVLSPIILSEVTVPTDEKSPQKAGEQEALLLLALNDVGHDPKVKAQIERASTNQQVIDILKQATLARFTDLVGGDPQAAGGELEPLGRVQDVFSRFKDGVGEVFDRAVSAPGRVTAIAALDGFRAQLNGNFTQFLGDVFVYLVERDGTMPGKPNGPIIETVWNAIRQAPRNSPAEPLIVMTHSMGGNILYDILTHYEPAAKIDVWISVASQVGEFEEMKIFKASDKNVTEPNQVKGLKTKVNYWLNVYDPADLLGFLAKPVFADADEDLEFHTGASAFKAHGAYFKRPSFYDEVRERLEKVLP